VLFSDRLNGVVAGGSPSIFDHVPNTSGVAPFYATSNGGVKWSRIDTIAAGGLASLAVVSRTTPRNRA